MTIRPSLPFLPQVEKAAAEATSATNTISTFIFVVGFVGEESEHFVVRSGSLVWSSFATPFMARFYGNVTIADGSD